MTYRQLFFEAFSEGCIATAKEMLPREQYQVAELYHRLIQDGRYWMAGLCESLLDITRLKPSVTPLDIVLRNVDTEQFKYEWRLWNKLGCQIVTKPRKFIDGPET